MTNVDGGVSTAAIYNYRMNSLVDINGGSGNTSLFVYLTVLYDIVTVSGSTIQGSGLNIEYKNLKNIIIDSLSGDDVFYVEGISIPLQLFGGGGLPGLPGWYPRSQSQWSANADSYSGHCLCQSKWIAYTNRQSDGWRPEPAGGNHNADPGW